MTREEFAEKLKLKNPSWAKIGNDDLVDSILKRYPTYKEQIDGLPEYQSSMREAARIETERVAKENEEPGFGQRLVQGIAKPFAEIGTSAYNWGKTVKNVVGAAVRGEDTVKDELGTKRDLGYLGETKPAFTGEENTTEAAQKMLGYGLEVGSWFIGAGGAQKAAGLGFKGAVKQGAKEGLKYGAGTGLLTGAAQPLQEGDATAGQVAISGLVGTLMGAAIGPALGGILGGAGYGASKVVGAARTKATVASEKAALSTAKKTYAKISDGLMQNLNKLKKSDQTKFFQQQNKSVGTWLNERKLAGTPEQTLENIADHFLNSKNAVDDSLNMLGGQYMKANTPSTFVEMIDDVVRFAKNTRDPRYPEILKLAEKYETSGLSMEEINIIKRFFESKNKFNYGRDLTGAEKTQWATNVDADVRTWQFEQADELGLVNLRELNKETQGSKFILDNLMAEEMGKLGNNQMSLTDWVVTAGGGWQELVLKKGLTSKTVQGFVAKQLNKLSGRGEVRVKPVIKKPNTKLLPAKTMTEPKLELPSAGVLEGQSKIK